MSRAHWSPSNAAYDMLKGTVVGGLMLVSMRRHEVRATKIRLHRITDVKPCQKILGHNANALYLSTMPKEMLCVSEKVKHFQIPCSLEFLYLFTKRMINLKSKITKVSLCFLR